MSERNGRILLIDHLVDHSISRAMDKGALRALMVAGEAAPGIFRSLTPSLVSRPSGH